MPRIVVVDRDADLLVLLTELLQDTGMEIVPCSDIGVAVECVRLAQPDLLILDLQVGDLNDAQPLLEEITCRPERRLIPLIVLSSHVEGLEERAGWVRERSSALLAKPFELDDIDRAIAEALNGVASRTVGPIDATVSAPLVGVPAS